MSSFLGARRKCFQACGGRLCFCYDTADSAVAVRLVVGLFAGRYDSDKTG